MGWMSRMKYLILPILLTILCLNCFVLDSAFATKGSYPGTNGKIAFSDKDPDPPYDFEIFVMDNDGSNIKQLTFNDEEDLNPCWSPDGTKIAFERGEYMIAFETIWVMDADGSNQRQLTTPRAMPRAGYDKWPSWSPDGEKIAFARTVVGIYNIYVIDANGPAGVGSLLIGGSAYSPSWSPDGSEIVFVVSAVISVADANTGSVKRTLGNGEDPCWSPDGIKIVFTYEDAIWVMNAADGSNRQQLSYPPQQPIDYEDDEPNWSPDGEKIVFTREVDSIWIMNADGSNDFDLTPDLPNAWQPDYQSITFAPVGGVTSPSNKLAILTPYIALAGLIAAVSTVYVVKRSKD